ncbi:MAG: AAA family ATPase [Microcoleaceae cyanobacterium]
MSLPPQDNVEIHNQTQVNTLARTLQLSAGQFSLLFARCNYVSLRQQIIEQLQHSLNEPFSLLSLDSSVHNLYRTIEMEMAQQPSLPNVLMVVGFEGIAAIDEVLDSANRSREAFLNLPFPIVLWINDKLWRKLNRQAPDFTSWATTTEFLQSSASLLYFLQDRAQQVVTTALKVGASQFIPNAKILGVDAATELQAAYQDLATRDVTLQPFLEASLRFVLGRHYYAYQEITEALEQYQLSLKFWETSERDRKRISPKTVLNHNAQNSNSHSSNRLSSSLSSDAASLNLLSQATPLEWQGLLLFHLGLCYIYLAEQHLQYSGQSDWEKAKVHLQGCINRFETANRQDLVAKFISKLGEVLRQLKRWNELWQLALRSQKLRHQLSDADPIQIAQDYGFLAEVALHRGAFENAKELAIVALENLDQDSTDNSNDPIRNQHRGLYLFILAQSLEHLGEPWEAIDKLEVAYRDTNAKYDPRLYLKILDHLNRLYFKLGEYREAFEIKKEYRTKSSTFGYTAFIGAGRLRSRERIVDPILGTISLNENSTFTDEIQASGREEAINRLLQRMAIAQHKLTVIYGQSGVGKSSILRAGLVPALKRYRVETRQLIPIIVRTYNAYINELDQKLSLSTNKKGQSELQVDDTNLTLELSNSNAEQFQEVLSSVIEKLKKNTDNNKITVLIFDQFEEFFFVYKTRAGRQTFFETLRDFLDLPFVKVIISLREDYIHYLLECVRFTYIEVINNDILNKDILFYLGNLTQAEASNVIKRLTDQSHFYLEDALVQALVEDLSDDFDEVRPIELQVVGSQIQAEAITTLAEYQQKGPKKKLVERFLEQVVHDCGPENERAARSILYLLTDENNTRPLKTRNELAEELRDELSQNSIDEQLDLVLYILEKSGLVSREIGIGASFYQLVHDYLADFIRQQHRSDRDAEFQQIVQEKNVYAKLALEREKLALETERRRRAEQRKRRSERFLGLLFGLFLVSLAGLGFWLTRKEGAARISAIEATTEALLVSGRNNQLGVLQASLNTGKSIQTTRASADIQTEVALGLRPTITNIQERNRLEGHESGVLGVVYSPDGTVIATASADRTVKIWSSQGNLFSTLNHDASVVDVSISDAGVIATVTLDLVNPDQNRVQLWQINGEKIVHAPISHGGAAIASISFSPDGKMLASGSWDKTIKLWTLDGALVRTLAGHQGRVQDVEFSPDGKTLASGSWDTTIKLWALEGTVLKTLRGHCESLKLNSGESQECIRHISFSPDGKRLVSASSDRTLKIWDLESGRVLGALEGHNEAVLSTSFSPDGLTIASSSRDRTVKLWNALNGTLLQTFSGHQSDVWAVVFNPEGRMMISASADKTARIWDYNRNPVNDRLLYGHTAAVWNVGFSPDSQLTATASDDNTVRLWDVALGKPALGLGGKPVLLQHNDDVSGVSFSPDGQTIATTSYDQTVKLWRLNGQLVRSLDNDNDVVSALSFSPDGKTLASASQTVNLWTLAGKRLDTLGLNKPAWDIEFNLLGNQIAVGTSDDSGTDTEVELWENQNGRWQRTLSLTPELIVQRNSSFRKSPNPPLSSSSAEINAFSYPPQADQLALAISREVRFWSSTKGGSCPISHSAQVESLSFSPRVLPSGDYLLVTASQDKQVRFWHVSEAQLWPESQTCSTVEPFYAINQDAIVNHVHFSPNGETLSIAQDNGVVTLWSMKGFELDYQIEQSCEWLTDYLNTNVNLTPESRALCSTK